MVQRAMSAGGNQAPSAGAPRREDALSGDVARSRRVIVLNGLFFPTAQRMLGAGLLLTWLVTRLSAAALWVGLIIPVQQGLGVLVQPLLARWVTTSPRRS